MLYTDVVVEENRDPMWHSPLAGRFSSCYGGFCLLATSFPLVEALEGFGVFTCEGLKIMAEIWGEHEFEGDVEWTLTLDLNHELARRLEAAGLLTEHAREHEHLLIGHWQLPMYNMDFGRKTVPLEELREQRKFYIP